MRTEETRLAFIDALKAIASQLIVLHHLAFYGPMSDVAQGLAPALFSWLSQDARIAVQTFLVIGGFLAAKALAPAGHLLTTSPLSLLKKRYLKLVIPYVAAILFSILCAAVARHFMDHDAIPDRPTLWQILAHITLLQGVLNVDSLSAGVWYIAIDFQLFALLLVTLWIARSVGNRMQATTPISSGVAMVAGLLIASLFYFNRDSNWDDWALYFFGAYGLGVMTYWATENKKAPIWFLLIASTGIAALFIDFRSRLAVALFIALALGIGKRWGFLEHWPKGRLLAYLGKISYSVFLTHFPVILIVNAALTRVAPESPAVNAAGIVVAWAACIASGALFYRFVERRAKRWQELAIDPVLRVLVRLASAFRTGS